MFHRDSDTYPGRETYNSETASVAHRSNKLSISHPLHSTLYHRNCIRSFQYVDPRIEEVKLYLLDIPSFLVRAVLKGIALTEQK